MSDGTFENWRKYAACRDVDVAIFFPTRGQSNEPAKKVCNGCPVRRSCLEEHLGEQFGIWGGMTHPERLRERRNRRNNAKGRAA